MQCQYCGAVQPVPDLEARQRALFERQRAEAHAQQRALEAAHRAEEARRAARREREEHAERKSSVRWGRLTMIFSMLLAPAIISVTMFDLPARLGFGGDGSDRIAIVAAQLTERGCQVVAPQASLYASSTVIKLVKLPRGSCLRVLAAGGPGHDSLKLRIFDLDGKEVAKSDDSSDPQAKFCPPAAGTLRYEVVPGLLDKGRLTHLALACPSAPPPPPAAAAAGAGDGSGEGSGSGEAAERDGSAGSDDKPARKRRRSRDR